MISLRAAQPSDLPALSELAKHLDSVNLPHDPERLAAVIERSSKSFQGKIDRSRREFLFVAVDADAAASPGAAERIVGSSMIFAQHGSRRAPHVFFDVLSEERYSETLDRHFRHKVLRIGYNYQGLTEFGGLVVLPSYRAHPERIGKQLVFARFLFMAMQPDLWCDEIVSELMPPLADDGSSHLWEALGRKFTGLTYQEADRLSRENKEFIRTLFPQDPIYATVLPQSAQDVIGQVGPRSQPVRAMLEKQGFRYANRIDPFDGGPHFHARVQDLVPVKDARVNVPVAALFDDDAEAVLALVAVMRTSAPQFVCCQSRVKVTGAAVSLSADAARELGVSIGDAVHVLPLAVPVRSA